MYSPSDEAGMRIRFISPGSNTAGSPSIGQITSAVSWGPFISCLAGAVCISASSTTSSSRTRRNERCRQRRLRYQLNPHFLFNTLNAISTMVLDGAKDSANLAISRLSDFLRYTSETGCPSLSTTTTSTSPPYDDVAASIETTNRAFV